MGAAVSDVRRLASEFNLLVPATPYQTLNLYSPGDVVTVTDTSGAAWLYANAATAEGFSGDTAPAWPTTPVPGTPIPDGAASWLFQGRGNLVKAVTDPAITAALADAAAELNCKVWGALYNQGQANLAAHKLAIANPQLMTPESEKVGDVSTSYQKRTADKDGYEQTRFGLEYLRLLRRLGLGFAAV